MRVHQTIRTKEESELREELARIEYNTSYTSMYDLLLGEESKIRPLRIAGYSFKTCEGVEVSPRVGLHVIPGKRLYEIGRRMINSWDDVKSPHVMKEIMNNLPKILESIYKSRSRYDKIIIDLPPLQMLDFVVYDKILDIVDTFIVVVDSNVTQTWSPLIEKAKLRDGFVVFNKFKKMLIDDTMFVRNVKQVLDFGVKVYLVPDIFISNINKSLAYSVDLHIYMVGLDRVESLVLQGLGYLLGIPPEDSCRKKVIEEVQTIKGILSIIKSLEV